jgi:hypothetical protein
MAKEKRDQVLRIIAQLDAHFADDDAFPADRKRDFGRRQPAANDTPCAPYP